MKKFLKRNRYTVILLVIFILFVFLGLAVKDIFVPDEGKATYGDRLKNIDKHPISNETYTKIDELLNKNSNVTKVSHRIQGKTLNYYITFSEKVTVKDAKAVGDSIIKEFDDYYDFFDGKEIISNSKYYLRINDKLDIYKYIEYGRIKYKKITKSNWLIKIYNV